MEAEILSALEEIAQTLRFIGGALIGLAIVVALS